VEERRLNLTWRGTEVTEYDQLAAHSIQEEVDLPDFVKAILRKHVEPG
jgi:hypothetical protein